VKRILTTATAILALGAGPALAMDEMAEGPSLSFSGKAQMGMIYTGDAEAKAGTVLSKGGITWNAEMDIGIAAKGVTDTGLTFGVSTNINAEVGSAAGATTIAAAAGSGDEVETPDVYIGGEIWKITVGTPDKASELAFSLNDIGYEGLGVDDVAENLGKLPGDTITTGRAAYANTGALNAGQVRVDLTLGAATVAISAGQTAGKSYKKGTPRQWATTATYFDTAAPTSGTRSTKFLTINLPYDTSTSSPLIRLSNAINIGGTGNDQNTLQRYDILVGSTGTNHLKDADGHTYYWIDEDGSGPKTAGTLYRVKGTVDLVPGTANEATSAADDDGVAGNDTNDSDTSDEVVGTKSGVHGLTNEDSNRNFQTARKEIAAVAEQMATKQKTNWAAGVSIPVGPAKLGFGVDSEKALMASVGADLGMVSGSVFYGQREISNTVKPKSMGFEVGFAAGGGTTINAVVSQYDPDMATNNQKLQGFGVGVSHDLGGGAKVQAGFAKVDGLSGATHTFVDGQTKASVGVTMAF